MVNDDLLSDRLKLILLKSSVAEGFGLIVCEDEQPPSIIVATIITRQVIRFSMLFAASDLIGISIFKSVNECHTDDFQIEQNRPIFNII